MLTEAKEVVPVGEGDDELVVSGPSQSEYDFIDRYIRFLVSQNLIYYEFYDYLIDWNERQVVPVFICPVTSRGSAVHAQVRKAAGDDFWLHEHPVRMAFGDSHTLYDPMLPMKVKAFGSVAERMRNG